MLSSLPQHSLFNLFTHANIAGVQDTPTLQSGSAQAPRDEVPDAQPAADTNVLDGATETAREGQGAAAEQLQAPAQVPAFIPPFTAALHLVLLKQVQLPWAETRYSKQLRVSLLDPGLYRVLGLGLLLAKGKHQSLLLCQKAGLSCLKRLRRHHLQQITERWPWFLLKMLLLHSQIAAP